MPTKGGWEVVKRWEQALENISWGWNMVLYHPLFSSLAKHVRIIKESKLCPSNGWAVVTNTGEIHVNATRLALPEEWTYVLAHCLLHLAFGHFQEQKRAFAREWNAACDCYIASFLADLDLGQPPKALKTLLFDLRQLTGVSVQTEERLYKVFCMHGLPDQLSPTGTAGARMLDMQYPLAENTRKVSKKKKSEPVDWQACFAEGLGQAVQSVVHQAGFSSDEEAHSSTETEQARNWFIGNFPLLGALAATFKIIEDRDICHRMEISVAAISMENREIYINPQAHLNELELRFVMAHELLHAGLRHDVRCAGRDPFLWNVACDYVINSWLIEMDIGTMPDIGGLYDSALKNESAEAIYDRVLLEVQRHPRHRI